MEISGKIVEILPLQEGTSKNGPWKKQEYVLEVPGNYPKKVCVTVWGERVDEFQIRDGETVTFSIDIESREYNSRWYTDVKAWRVSRPEAGSTSEPPVSPPEGPAIDPPTIDPDEDEDDLPF